MSIWVLSLLAYNVAINYWANCVLWDPLRNLYIQSHCCNYLFQIICSVHLLRDLRYNWTNVLWNNRQPWRYAYRCNYLFHTVFGSGKIINILYFITCPLNHYMFQHKSMICNLLSKMTCKIYISKQNSINTH